MKYSLKNLNKGIDRWINSKTNLAPDKEYTETFLKERYTDLVNNFDGFKNFIKNQHFQTAYHRYKIGDFGYLKKMFSSDDELISSYKKIKEAITILEIKRKLDGLNQPFKNMIKKNSEIKYEDFIKQVLEALINKSFDEKVEWFENNYNAINNIIDYELTGENFFCLTFVSHRREDSRITKEEVVDIQIEHLEDLIRKWKEGKTNKGFNASHAVKAKKLLEYFHSLKKSPTETKAELKIKDKTSKKNKQLTLSEIWSDSKEAEKHNEFSLLFKKGYFKQNNDQTYEWLGKGWKNLAAITEIWKDKNFLKSNWQKFGNQRELCNAVCKHFGIAEEKIHSVYNSAFKESKISIDGHLNPDMLKIKQDIILLLAD